MRSLKYVNYLKDKFEKIIIITEDFSTISSKYKYDSNLLDGDSKITTLNIKSYLGPYSFENKSKYSINYVLGSILIRLFRSSGADWVFPLYKTFNKIIKDYEIKYILHTGSPFIPMISTALFSKLYGIKYILDYRDPWTQNPRGLKTGVYSKIIFNTLEKYVNKNSITIIGIGKEILNLICNNKYNRKLVIKNLPDKFYVRQFMEDSLCSMQLKFKYNITISGTIYKECDPSPILNAINHLPLEIKKDVCLNYCGLSSSLFNKFCEDYDINIKNHGYISKKDATSLVCSSNILISLNYNSNLGNFSSANCLITTKVFDYLLSGKPVINVGLKDSELCQFIDSIGYQSFFTFDYNDSHQISTKILSILKNNKISSCQVNFPLFGSDNSFDKIFN